MAFFTNQLLKWYKQNQRKLPWRKTRDPYKIWLSEIILQQTRIAQGTGYYNKFIREFPDVASLAMAKQDKVMKLWQGLGYYTRARNLHAAAKEIEKKHKGQVPDNYNDLIKLKGIGDYTASAILSIAFSKPFPVVDGNVIRVISRIYGITKPVSSADALNEIKTLAKKLMPINKPGNFNQAIMEFGALQCKPQNPDCAGCCLNSICIAFKKNIVGALPVKKETPAIKERHLNYFLITYKIKKTRYIYIRKRTGNDIWKNLYDLPCIETKVKAGYDKIKTGKEWKTIFGNHKTIVKGNPKAYIHELSHQTIYAVFYNVSVLQALKKKSLLKKIKADDFQKLPVPRLIEKYLLSQNLILFSGI
ncbi:MAG: A/G-specific adenine glycosylase [Bacteroidota bacterium]